MLGNLLAPTSVRQLKLSKSCISDGLPLPRPRRARATAKSAVGKALRTPTRALEDVFWALLNSKEFLYK